MVRGQSLVPEQIWGLPRYVMAESSSGVRQPIPSNRYRVIVIWRGMSPHRAMREVVADRVVFLTGLQKLLSAPNHGYNGRWLYSTPPGRRPARDLAPQSFSGFPAPSALGRSDRIAVIFLVDALRAGYCWRRSLLLSRGCINLNAVSGLAPQSRLTLACYSLGVLLGRSTSLFFRIMRLKPYKTAPSSPRRQSAASGPTRPHHADSPGAHLRRLPPFIE